MTPDFKVTGQEGDLTDNFRDRLISLTVTDNAAEVSDALDISLSNADRRLIIPDKGAILTVSLGYTGQLRVMGSYMIDAVILSGPPDMVRVQGKAAPFTGAAGQKPIQSRKTRSWSGMTIGEIFKTIAKDNGLQAAIDDEMAQVPIPHIDQLAESDMNLLTRLSREYGAVFKPMMGRLVFSKRGTSKSVNGKSLKGITLDREDVISYQATIGRRTRKATVSTRYHDNNLGQTVTLTRSSNVESVVSGSSVTPASTTSIDGAGYEDDTTDAGADYQHPHPYPDAATAAAAADSMLDQSERGEHNIEVTLAGHPEFMAEGTLTLTGDFPSAIEKDWIITAVQHTLAKDRGYETKVISEKKRSKEKATDATADAINLSSTSNVEGIVSGGSTN
ncbi:MAG: contractile injection system protein, VgrG/Pvc8 family [Verrucomicrobium sp.]|nr:contractile injection system protein, VgrG/Pvc8 family [Verrucomicrobium sp.]